VCRITYCLAKEAVKDKVNASTSYESIGWIFIVENINSLRIIVLTITINLPFRQATVAESAHTNDNCMLFV